jgi:hypothetical protein
MTLKRYFVVAVTMISILISTLKIVAQTGDPIAVQRYLEAQILISAITADRSDIVTPGTVVQLKREGLSMYGIMSPMAPSYVYKNGKIAQDGRGITKSLWLTMSAPGGLASGGYPMRRFVPGENCWVTGISVQNDGVVLKLYSDPYENLRYYANLKIPFANKNQVPQPEMVMALIDDVLAVMTPPTQAGPIPAAPALSIEPPQHSAPQYAPIAPPAAAPATITVGQTREQLIAAYGEPARKAAIGEKEIYSYQDLKVTLLNGKVSNVE